ncbi:hypothetical protein [Nostoc sp.]|uniref:hypothetical protein n=1 Tax=Nostoc sp. TaxID=1180 RepID=UPI002FF4E0B3
MAVIVRSLPQKSFAKGNFTLAHLPNQIANTIIGNGFAASISDLHPGDLGKQKYFFDRK